MVIIAIVAVVAATMAWLSLRPGGARTPPRFVDLVVVLLMSLAAALSVGAPVA